MQINSNAVVNSRNLAYNSLGRKGNLLTLQTFRQLDTGLKECISSLDLSCLIVSVLGLILFNVLPKAETDGCK